MATMILKAFWTNEAWIKPGSEAPTGLVRILMALTGSSRALAYSPTIHEAVERTSRLVPRALNWPYRRSSWRRSS